MFANWPRMSKINYLPADSRFRRSRASVYTVIGDAGVNISRCVIEATEESDRQDFANKSDTMESFRNDPTFWFYYSLYSEIDARGRWMRNSPIRSRLAVFMYEQKFTNILPKLRLIVAPSRPFPTKTCWPPAPSYSQINKRSTTISIPFILALACTRQRAHEHIRLQYPMNKNGILIVMVYFVRLRVFELLMTRPIMGEWTLKL